MASIRESFSQEWRTHKTLLLVSLVYSGCSIIYALLAGTRIVELEGIFGLMGVSLLTTYGFFGGIYAIFMLKQLLKIWLRGSFRGSFRAAAGITNELASDYVSSRAFCRGVISLVALLSINFAMAFKSLIHFVNPYKWDPALARLDKMLFMGVYPQKVIIPYIDMMQKQTQAMNFFYNFWFVVFIVATGYALFFDRDVKRRLVYLWSFLLIWIFGGSILATVFSSVGPVFYHEFYPQLTDPYKGMLGNTMSSSAIFQEIVKWSTSDRHISPNGLSAFPSMHIAIAAVIAIYAWNFNAYIFALVALYGVGVFMATIYTGLHYVVDGYAGIFLAALFWWISSRWLVPHALKEEAVSAPPAGDALVP